MSTKTFSRSASNSFNPIEIGKGTKRREFLSYLGGAAILAGLSPKEWIFNSRWAARPAASVLMEPGPSPTIKGLTPFALILCAFNDLPPLTIPSSVFYDYVAGPGKSGVFDYWRDISYGTIDLTGSKVFGPYTMKYSFSRDGNQGRGVWTNEAIRLATEDPKSDFRRSDFYGVIAVVNAPVDDSNDGGRNLSLGIKVDWGQSNWRWCNKCQGLTFGGAGAGNCPAGGVHDLSTSFDYLLLLDDNRFPGQNTWRWCKKCQGLAYAGAPSGPGICPAGGKHDHSASGDYTLLNFGADEPFLVQTRKAGGRWVDFQRGVSVLVEGIDTVSYTATVTI